MLKGVFMGKIFCLIFFSLLCLQYSAGNHLDSAGSFCYVINGADIGEIISSEYKIAVIDYSSDGSADGMYSASDIKDLKDSDIIPLCYLSIGEAEDYRFYWRNSWHSAPPEWLGTENPRWEGNYKVRYWDYEWQDIISEYLSKIISQGFGGVYLDTVDSYYYWSAEQHEISLKEAAACMSRLIEMIRKKTDTENKNDFYIIFQNAEDILEYAPEILDYVDGIGVEELLFSDGRKNDDEEIEYRLKYLKKFKNSGKTVMMIEYLTDEHGITENKKRNQLEAFAKKNDFMYYIACDDLELDELNDTRR